MKTVYLSLIVLLVCAAASAQTWQPIVNLNVRGYCDAGNRCSYRTNSGTLYVLVNASPLSSGSSTLKIFKATVKDPVGGSFTEMDASHEPSDGTRFVGLDGRLNTITGIISIVYQPTSGSNARYTTFNTNTDTWGTPETIASVSGVYTLRYYTKTAMALDTNGIPHAIYAGSNQALIYNNRIGGAWSASLSVGSDSNDLHPSVVMGLDNVLHLTWMNTGGSRTIYYRERSAAGVWSSIETVAASIGTTGDIVDQSPSIALDSDNLPLILYHEQSDTHAYANIKKRTAANTYVDYSPTQGSGAAGHDWSIAVSWAGDWTICGHSDATLSDIEPTCMRRIGGTSGSWGTAVRIVNDGRGRDGSQSIRYDPIYPGSTTTIDVTGSDEASTESDWFYNADITGSTGGDTPTATLSTASLTFPNQIVGTTSAGQTVSVTNTGGGSLTISSITAPTGFSETDNCSSALSQGASCQINVTFTPPSTGSFSGSLAIADNAGNSPQAVSLNGTGVTQTSSISGTISPAAGGSGATVTLSGASSATVTANSSGVYTFSGLADGSYTVTPSQPGETFSPANRAVTVSGSNVTGVNFTAIANTVGETLFTSQSPAVLGASDGSSANYELGLAFSSGVAGSVTAIRFWKDARETGTHTGHLWTASGQLLATAVFSSETASGWQQANLPGAVQIAANTQYVASVNTGRTFFVVTVGGLAAKVTNLDLSSVVGNNGLYGSAGLFPVNSYQHSNYFRDVVFSPSSFLLTASGSVLPATTGAGTTLTLLGASSATATADANGNYSFSGLSNGSYTVTPSKTGFTFTPANLPFTLSGSNATGLNFSAVAQTGSISGTISPLPGGSGATVTLSGAASATVATDSNGNYSFTSLPFGNYSVTPSETGFTFTPASQSVTVNSTTGVVVNFTAVAQTVPILNLTPSTRSFGATQGGATPPSSVVNISNTGSGTLNYTVTSDQSWLSASPVSGTAPQALTVSAVTGTLVAGTYTGHLMVTASGAQGSPGIVTITFVVLPQVVVQPLLSIAPTSLTFTATQGGANPE